jgi:hypothetical protein
VPDNIHILGIRHHGAGSARSLRRALDEIQPKYVLVEGPPDGNEAIAFAAREEMKPPVALLVHDVEKPADAVYYPFAEFSPEWQAIRWALEHDVPVRFMDLPQVHRMALEAERLKQIHEQLEKLVVAAPVAVSPAAVGAADGDDPESKEAAPEPAPQAAPETAFEALPQAPPIPRDPLQQLAEAAGFDDGERWWEHVVECRRDHGKEIFISIREAMAELRAGDPRPRDIDEPLREAWMRRTIRQTTRECKDAIAVVCGAWHAPALDIDAIPKKQDDELLKSLPKVKTAATWVPWTFDRLTFASGYGAGIRSPGWYEHLWKRESAILESWMTRVARLLREKEIDCSSAHVIEAVRLAESLAVMRGRPLADLSDIADATRAIFCFDSDIAMRLIESDLLIGHRMGELPDDVPMVPLQQDLLRQQKRLRLKPEAQDKPIDLDLRNETDRQRSVLLHRLRLLGIDWGTPSAESRSKGTFRESWTLRWAPEFAIALIDAGMLGNTVEQASQARLVQLAKETDDLRSLSARLQDAMLADLGAAAEALVRRIESIAAIAADVTLLMETLPSLANLLRYGNVRKTDETMVRQIVNGMIPRITVGLGGAVASLNDEAAVAVEQHINATDQAIALIESDEHTQSWRDALARIVNQPTVHGLIRGRCARLLLDAGRLDRDAVAQQLGQSLSRGNDPSQGARWLQGFLGSSGLMLIHDPRLLALVDDWMADIGTEIFEELLPLLRRSFSTLPSGERRQIGELICKPAAVRRAAPSPHSADFNPERAARPLPLIIRLLGGAP